MERETVIQEVFLRRKELIRQKIRRMCLFDDEFMTRVFEGNPEGVELILRIILEKPDLTVIEFHVQHDVKNLQGRSVRLDILAADSEGTRYNIEIQKGSGGAGPRRARYNSSLMDTDVTLPGDDTENLPETIVIFITEADYYGAGLPLYHIERRVRELDRDFGDGASIIYVNGSYRGGDALGRLMHDFSCADPSEMYSAALSRRARYYKDDEKGVNFMSGIMQELMEELEEDIREAYRQAYRQEGLQEGRQEGIQEGRQEAIQEGIRAMIEILQELGQDYHTTSTGVARKYALSPEDARSYMQAYWREA